MWTQFFQGLPSSHERRETPGLAWGFIGRGELSKLSHHLHLGSHNQK